MVRIAIVCVCVLALCADVSACSLFNGRLFNGRFLHRTHAVQRYTVQSSPTSADCASYEVIEMQPQSVVEYVVPQQRVALVQPAGEFQSVVRQRTVVRSRPVLWRAPACANGVCPLP